MPGDDGAADVDVLYERRRRELDTDHVVQVTAGVDVMDDRLVYVVVGFSVGNAELVVLDFDVVLGDPLDGEVWAAAESAIGRTFGGLPVSACSVDAGHLTSRVKEECARRRMWFPTVGRQADGTPLARKRSPSSGLFTMGVGDASAMWSGRCVAGKVQIPWSITRQEVGELCAAEALSYEHGKVSWQPIAGRQNHLWDCAKLACHARALRPLGGPRRRIHVAVGGRGVL